MGVVHLAQGPDGKRVALKVLRPHIVGDREARERLAREVSSLQRISSPRIAEILDADPHGPVPFVVTRYVPGLSLYHHVAEEGPIAGRRPAALRRRAGRGAPGRAPGRRAAPRHQADQRADGGALAGPDRLRPGPGGRGPAPHPDRLAARHARLPRARDPVRRRRDRRLRRARLGRDRGVRGDRAAAVRQGARRWRSWTASGAASTTSPASPSRSPGCCASASRPSRWSGRRVHELRVRLAGALRPATRRPRRRTRRPSPSCGRCRSRRRPPPTRPHARDRPAPRRRRRPIASPTRSPAHVVDAAAQCRRRRAGRATPDVPQTPDPAPADPPRSCRPDAARSQPSRRPLQARPDVPRPEQPRVPYPVPPPRQSSRAQRVLQLLGLGALTERAGRLRAVRRDRARRGRRAGPAHRLGHPPAARPPADGPRPRPVVRRARRPRCRCPATCCSRSSGRSRWSPWRACPGWRCSRWATCSASRSTIRDGDGGARASRRRCGGGRGPGGCAR